MSLRHVPPSPASRAEARRAQIRAAAAQCFREHGFHGTSIARISRVAGMSPGHIYHYFENKEAIIADIVAQDLERLLTLLDELRTAPDVRDAIIECAAESVERQLDPDTAALRLEVVAEAARNPRIAEIVRHADRSSRESLAETIRGLRRSAGFQDDETAIAAMVELIVAMFEGLQVRSVRHPELDRDGVIRLYRCVLHDLFTRPADAGKPG